MFLLKYYTIFYKRSVTTLSRTGFSQESRLYLEPTQPPIQCRPGALSQGENRLVREADNYPPFSVEVMNEGSCKSSPSYVPEPSKMRFTRKNLLCKELGHSACQGKEVKISVMFN